MIWVAAGQYIPSTNDRHASFFVKSGVQVYGGFSGRESDLSQRNPALNQTILSGEIGDPHSPKDNSFSIVRFEGASTKTVLDGFIIANSYAEGLSYDREPITCGGGIYNDGKQQPSSPQISNCVFRNNYARYGGAIYNHATNGLTSPVLTNCVFVNNEAQFIGGAIFNDGQLGVANGVVRNCQFQENRSNIGSCIANQGTAGESSPLIDDCQFSDNFGMSDPNPIYDIREGRGKTNKIVQNSVFERNTSMLTANQPGMVDQNNRPSKARSTGY